MPRRPNTAPTASWADVGGGRRIAATLRYLASVTSLVIILLVGVTSVAQAASNFYWYGENNSTCWQTGQAGSPHNECDSVGAGYLPTPGGYSGGLAHMLEDTAGGIGEDFNLSPSGDYCSYYRVGGPVLTSQDSTNEGVFSGLTMPMPYSSYQEGDKRQTPITRARRMHILGSNPTWPIRERLRDRSHLWNAPLRVIQEPGRQRSTVGLFIW
jgi:hypothetical protein